MRKRAGFLCVFFRRINTHTWWDSLTFTSSRCLSSSHVSVSNKRDTIRMPQPGHSVCHYCFALPLDFPAGALASERPLWHQPVINILNKPADGWSLSRFSLKGMFTQGPHDGQQRHGRVNKSFFSHKGITSTERAEGDVITVFDCCVSDWVNLRRVMLERWRICFKRQRIQTRCFWTA